MPKHIRIPCPECARELRVRPEYVGRHVQCKHCQHSFAIPRHLTVKCPQCRVDGKIRTENVGREIQCKHCGAAFSTQPADSATKSAPVQAYLGASTTEPDDANLPASRHPDRLR